MWNVILVVSTKLSRTGVHSLFLYISPAPVSKVEVLAVSIGHLNTKFSVISGISGTENHVQGKMQLRPSLRVIVDGRTRPEKGTKSDTTTMA